MTVTGWPAIGELGVAATRRKLIKLHDGLLRTTELCAAWVLAEADTWEKIAWGQEVWRFARCVDLVHRRLDELGGRDDGDAGVGRFYIEMVNRMFALVTTAARKGALYGLVLPDLLGVAVAQREATSSFCDEPSASALTDVIALLSERARPKPSPDTALERLFRVSGGVAGDAALPADEDRHSIAQLVSTPARDPGLEVRTKVPRPPITEYRVEFLHTLAFDIEICAAEICACILVEHRDAPWGLRFDMARQTWDEMRHAASLLLRVEALGGHLGMYPIDREIWNNFRAGESAAEQLMIEQRLGEGEGLDGCLAIHQKLVACGDLETAAIFEYILADEINHVRRGNFWIRHLVGGDDSEVAALETRVRAKLRRIGVEPTMAAFDVAVLRQAGFTDAEIAALPRKLMIMS